MADSLFLSTLKASRRQKYGDLDIKEFSQMFKEGAVDKLPNDLAYHLTRYRPQNDDELSLWVYTCLEKQGLSAPLTRLPNHLQMDLKGTCSHLDYLGDVFFDRVENCIVLGNRGGGKCLGKGTPVMMWDGTIKPVEDVQVGDKLMGDDSTPRTVLSTTVGFGDLYKVTPKKGDPYIVNDVHILSLKYGKLYDKKGNLKAKSGQVVDISVQDYLASNPTQQELLKGYRIPIRKFQDSDKRSYTIPPYLLGVWLGDGRRYDFSITTHEPEIISYLYEIADIYNLGVRVVPEKTKTIAYATYHLTTKQRGRGHKHPFLEYLRQNHLNEHKFIPHEYKTGSWEDRLEILAGLLDTDGSLTHDGSCIEITSKYKQLAEDIAFIARSLGLAGYVKEEIRTCTNSPAGPKKGVYYRLKICGQTEIIPLRVARRKPHPRQLSKDVLLTGIQVEPYGQGEYYGFEIDGNRRFLLGDFTVTHNTLVFAISMFLEAYFKPNIEIAHLGAIEDQAKRCYRYFRKIVEHPLFVGTLARQASGSRAEFANGSIVEILVGTMAGVNGPHSQHVSIDEVELMDWAILQEAFNMARDAKGYKGATRLTSTRKKNSGTMQKILDEADERGLKIYQWNLWDTIETCPLATDSSGHIIDTQEVYFDTDDIGHQVSTMVYKSCMSCPMLAGCKGQAKMSNAGQKAVVSLDDAKKLYTSLDPSVWDAQVICIKPGSEAMVYPMFKPEIQVVDYQAGLKQKYGEDYDKPYDVEYEVYAGQDAGFICPATVFLQVIDDPITGDQLIIVFDEIYEHNIAPSKYIREFLWPKHREYNVQEWFCDPSNSAQLMAEMEEQDLYPIEGLKSVDEGIDACRAAFSLGHLLIDKHCKNLIWELNRYEKNPKTGRPIKEDDHLVDAMRYGVNGVGIYQNVVDTIYT